MSHTDNHMFRSQLKSFEHKLLLASFLLLSLSLIPRYYDILRFLPDYSIDENDIVERAVGFMGGDLTVYWHRYGPLYSYLLAAVYTAQSAFDPRDFASFVQDVFFAPTKFYYTARFFSSSLNILLAFLTYGIARKYYTQKIAAIAFFLAVFPFVDRLTDFGITYFTVRIDSLLAVWSMATLFFALRITVSGTLKDYLFAGVFFGLGFATKPLPALLILPTIFLAHVLSFQKNHDLSTSSTETQRAFFPALTRSFQSWNIYFFMLCSLFSCIIFYPSFLIDFPEFLSQQLNIILTDGSRDFLPGWDLSRFFHPLGHTFTFAAVIALGYCLAQAIVQKDSRELVLLSYPLVFWFAFSIGAARDYFYIPIIPVCIICIAKGLSDMSNLAALKRFSHVWIALCLLLLLLQPAVSIAKRSFQLNTLGNDISQHTTLAGKKWIEQNFPLRTPLLLYGYYPFLPRIVDFRREAQAQYGEYFMYYRGKNQFLQEQFF